LGQILNDNVHNMRGKYRATLTRCNSEEALNTWYLYPENLDNPKAQEYLTYLHDNNVWFQCHCNSFTVTMHVKLRHGKYFVATHQGMHSKNCIFHRLSTAELKEIKRDKFCKPYELHGEQPVTDPLALNQYILSSLKSAYIEYLYINGATVLGKNLYQLTKSVKESRYYSSVFYGEKGLKFLKQWQANPIGQVIYFNVQQKLTYGLEYILTCKLYIAKSGSYISHQLTLPVLSKTLLTPLNNDLERFIIEKIAKTDKEGSYRIIMPIFHSYSEHGQKLPINLIISDNSTSSLKNGLIIMPVEHVDRDLLKSIKPLLETFYKFKLEYLEIWQLAPDKQIEEVNKVIGRLLNF
jgi:hypothetical protein